MGKINIKDGIAGETIVSIKSEQDSSGQKIDTTYLKEVSAEGKTLTYTKGDGTTTSDDITLTASDVGADVSGSAENALNSAKTYTDKQITDVSETINNHINNTSNPHGVTKKDLNLENVENKSSAIIRSEITKDNVTSALGYTPYTPNEVDNKLSALETNIDWKESVDTFDSIATTYSNPKDGWTVNVKDTDYTYRYNGTSWVAISANAIPKATNSVDGLLSKEDHTNYEDANSKKHTHDNKSVIDGISSTNVSNWNSAKTHADSTHARTDATKVEKSSTNGNIKINGTETTVYTHPSGTNPHGTTKTDLGLSKVENKSSADIRGEITKDNVTNALGYTPSKSDTTYDIATDTKPGLIKSGGDIKVETDGTISIEDDSHNHVISNIDNLQTTLDGKVPTSRTINNKSLSANITLSASDIGADASGSATSALTSANKYTDSQINTVNTNLTTHTTDSTIHVTNEDKAKIDKGSSHADSAHAPSNAEENVINTIQVNDVNLTPTNKTVNITIPTKTSELTNNSGYLTTHQDISGKANISDLATVATSGSYKDLKNIPTSFAPSSHKHSKSEITDFPTSMTPTAHNQASNTINAMTGYSKATAAGAITTGDSLNTAIGKLEKALDSKGTSSFSGSYNDLTNKPTIPTVGNGTITINQNKTKIGEFTTNQSGDTTIDLTDTNYTLPTATSTDLGGVKIGSNINISDGKISIYDASTTAKGVVKLDDRINSTATNTAATSSAVKSAYDLANNANTTANAAMPKSGGTFKGSITLNADPTSNLEAATKQYVDNQISNKIAAADAMVFKGTLGTGGIVTSVPTTKVVKGDTYKIITNGKYSGYTCKIGDLLIALNSGSITANTTNWAHVPSGDEYDSDMVGATSSNAGIHGLVPAPSAGLANRYLRSDGVWSIPPDTTVTSVDNHYTPTTNSGSTLSVDASSTTSASWGSTNLVTGVNIQRDSKGHVTGVTVDSIKMPANPNTNTSHSHNVGTGLSKEGNGGTSGTVTYSLKPASSGEIGGIKVSSVNNNLVTVNNESTTSGRYYSIELNSDGKAIVNVPWTDTNTIYNHPTSGVTAGTYNSVAVDKNGHVTNGTNPTTLSGYGITDGATKTETVSLLINKSEEIPSRTFKANTWYRIYKPDFCFNAILNLYNIFAYNPSQVCNILISKGWEGTPKFSIIGCSGSSQVFSKIRVVFSTSARVCYIDVCYDSTYSNHMRSNLIPLDRDNNHDGYSKFNFEEVTSIEDGYTAVECKIPLNSEVATTTFVANNYFPQSTITTVTDLNTLRTTGIYHINVANCTNAPSDHWGTLFVDFTTGTPYQIYITDGATMDIYKRQYMNSSWGSWMNGSLTDTKNTAGATDTSSKIFLVGATSQAANPQTYSHDTVYIGTDGCLYSNKTKVSVDGHTHTVTHTPAGTIANTSITPAGSVTSTFTGSSVTSGASSGTTSVYSITGVGSVPTLTASVSDQCLTLSFNPGSVPTRSSVTLPSTSHTHSVTAAGTVSSTFKGTTASHNHTFTGTSATLTTG